MGRNLDDIINILPAARQNAIIAASRKMIADMRTKQAIVSGRGKRVGKTQSILEKDPSIAQEVSSLDKRPDKRRDKQV